MRDTLFPPYAGGYFVEESTLHLWPAFLNKRFCISGMLGLLSSKKDSLVAGILESTFTFRYNGIHVWHEPLKKIFVVNLHRQQYIIAGKHITQL